MYRTAKKLWKKEVGGGQWGTKNYGAICTCPICSKVEAIIKKELIEDEKLMED